MSGFLTLTVMEFMLRYTVIIGVILAVIGASICMLAKGITKHVRGVEEINKQDKLYTALLLVGLVLIMAGAIVIALPFGGTFYKA